MFIVKETEETLLRGEKTIKGCLNVWELFQQEDGKYNSEIRTNIGLVNNAFQKLNKEEIDEKIGKMLLREKGNKSPGFEDTENGD